MMRQTPRPMYSFPELKSAEILQCMADLNISLLEAELQKPSAQVVQKVYEAFAEIFLGTNKDEYIAQENSPFMANLDYGEIYVDAVSLVRFYRVVVRLMREVGIEDFGIKDLIKPEPPRFKVILSAVINFAKFREEQLAIYEELSRKSEDIRAERDRVMSRYQELTSQLSQWRKMRADEEPLLQKVKEQNNQTIHDLRELKREQTALTSVIEELKAKRQEYNEKLVYDADH
jgi:kinetochore protein Nuf2